MRSSGCRASILLITMMCIMAMAVFAIVFLDTVLFNNRNATYQYNDARAFYLAEAGLDKAVWYLLNTAPDGSKDGSWKTEAYPKDPGPEPTDPQQESLGDGSYTIWVEIYEDTIKLITARGSYQGRVRTVQQIVNYVAGSPPGVDPKLGTWKEI